MALFPGKKDGKRSSGSGASTPGSPSSASKATRQRGAAPARPATAATPPRGRKGRKGKGVAKVAGAAGPLHERRRRLVSARETTLRDLGGLMLEMYKRNRFREELLLDKCEEVLAIEVEVAHIDQRLFQLAPPNSAGQRPIGRCECGAPILPGQNFCGVCGRAFATLTQTRSCERCGGGLRPGDTFCANCGTSAPDGSTAIDAGPGGSARQVAGATIVSSDLADPGGTIAVVDDDGAITTVLTPEGNDAHAATLDTPHLDDGPPAIDSADVALKDTDADAGAGDVPGLELPDAASVVAAPIDVVSIAGSPADADTSKVDSPAPDGDTTGTDAPAKPAPPTGEEQKELARAKAKRISELKKAKAKAAKERAKARARDARRGRGSGG